MEFSDTQLEKFESIVNKSDALSIASYVDPDALVISDGEQTIRVSQAKAENEMFMEIDGHTNTVETTATDRVAAMEEGLRLLCEAYDGDLHRTALNF